jgi:outer membrane protein assembly factor BamD
MRSFLPSALCPLLWRPASFAALSVILGLSACAGNRPATALGADAEKLLFDRGTAELKEENWIRAREYLQELLQTYPQSSFRAEAKLGVGDAFLGEGSTSAYVYATNEYREFLSFYPTNPRADYAQFQLGMVQFRQMLGPQRDQTFTKEAIREFVTFIERYPNSPLVSEARQRLREARDRLAESELETGRFYLRIRWYPGAEDRLRGLLKSDPEFTRKDSAYFYLAETLEKVAENLQEAEKKAKKSEALPYYERLVQEYESSEHLEEAKKRITRLKGELGL